MPASPKNTGTWDVNTTIGLSYNIRQYLKKIVSPTRRSENKKKIKMQV